MSIEVESFVIGEVEGDQAAMRATGQAITLDQRIYVFGQLIIRWSEALNGQFDLRTGFDFGFKGKSI
jgi:hypothetical protein